MFRTAFILAAAVGSAISAAQGLGAFETHATGRAPIVRATDGHYWAAGLVNGRAVRFLVDTGATNVSLTRGDARLLGVEPSADDFTRPVRTAAGPTRAAVVRLASVSVAGVRVNGVEALVFADGLPNSLLGMSYLGRLSRLEASPNGMVLTR